jgi:hypothetical protein
MKKEIKDILIALNSSGPNYFEKYPIGNKELTQKVHDLENAELIKFNAFKGLWEIEK